MSEHGSGSGQVIDIDTWRRSRSPVDGRQSVLYLCPPFQRTPMVRVGADDPPIPIELLSTLPELQQALQGVHGEAIILIDITPGDTGWLEAAQWLSREPGLSWIGVLLDFEGPLRLRAFELGAFDVIPRSEVREELRSLFMPGFRLEGLNDIPRGPANNLSEMPRGFWRRMITAIRWRRRRAH